MTRRLYKDSFLLLASEGSAAFLSAVTTLLMARWLPVSEFGLLISALAFAQIVAIVVDSGMGQLVARDLGRGTSQSLHELNQLFTWRLILIVIVSALNPLIAWVFLPSSAMWKISLVLTPSILFIMTGDFFSWIFKGVRQIAWSALIQVGSRVLLLALCLLALFSSHPMKFLLAAYAMGGVIILIGGLYVLSRSVHAVRWVRLDRPFFLNVLPALYKMGSVVILSVVFSRMDVMLVAKMCGTVSAGLFGSAARLTDGFRMVAIAAYGICLPLFSSVHDQRPALRQMFRAVYLPLIVVGTLAAMAGHLFAQPLFVHLLGPAYQMSAQYFRPLAWNCPLNFANVIMLALLYAVGDYQTPVVTIVVTVLFDLALNLLLVPHYGPIAASWARMAAEAVGFGIQVRGVARRGILSVYELVGWPVAVVGITWSLLMGLRGQHPLAVVGMVALCYYALTLLDSWSSLLAARWLSSPAAPPDLAADDEHPFLYVVAPCRDAMESIPGLVDCLKRQDYPADRYRILLLIDSDDETDPARAAAASYGVDVYLRCRGAVRTKGDALNELLDRRLRNENFDGAIFLDIDSRVDPHFLARSAAYLRGGASVVQCVQVGKNPGDTVLTRVGGGAFGLAHLHQIGRAALGLPALLMGAGITFSRQSLVRLEWRFGTSGHLAEDLEVTVRCVIGDLFIRYAPDQAIGIDLPEQASLIRRQRRRWTAGCLELIPDYTLPLLRKALSGDWKALLNLFAMLLEPPFSTTFVVSFMLSVLLWALRFHYPALTVWAAAFSILWLSHALYYVLALHASGHPLTWRHVRGFVVFSVMRILGILDGMALLFRPASSDRWQPMPHKDDKTTP